jgi:hypothetical protein
VIYDKAGGATMNGEAMQLDKGDDRKPAARRRSSGGGNGSRRSSVSGDGTLDFSSTVERILSNLEQRGDDHPAHHGPLLQIELSKLSMLCTQQQQQQQQHSRSSNKKETAATSSEDNGNVLDNDLGFADVDVDMTLEIVGYLEKHVALASGINIVQSTFQEIQRIQAGGGNKNIDQVSLPS